MSEIEAKELVKEVKRYFKKAKRQSVPLKIGLGALSGGGKTYSALLLAKGLTGDLSKVCVLDTENNSAVLYDHLGDFSTLVMKPPFEPERFAAAIKIAEDEGFECIIIDSASHEWSGSGGCLDIHQKLGGRFQDWAVVTPRHNIFLEAIKQAKIHVICTSRQKEDAALTNEGGKVKVVKAGLKDEQREGFAYEMTLMFDLNREHLAAAQKDRTGMFMGKTPFIITEETGKQLLKWSKGETNE